MKELLEQFKNLNTRDPGAWPPLPKAMLLLGLLIGIVALGYFLDWQEQMESLEAGRVQETKLKDEYVAKERQAIKASGPSSRRNATSSNASERSIGIGASAANGCSSVRTRTSWAASVGD